MRYDDIVEIAEQSWSTVSKIIVKDFYQFYLTCLRARENEKMPGM